MRPARQKRIKKQIRALNSIGFRAPYNILADHAFLEAFNRTRMSPSVLENLLAGSVKLWTTSCEYKKYKEVVSDKRLIGAVDLKKCEHSPPLDTPGCVEDLLKHGNEHHYFLAVSPEHKDLKSRCKAPVIFTKSSVLFIELSDSNKALLRKKAQPKGASEQEKKLLESLFSTSE